MYKVIIKHLLFREALEFDRRVHVVLRRKMPKPPIVRLPTIELDFIKHPSGGTLYL